VGSGLLGTAPMDSGWMKSAVISPKLGLTGAMRAGSQVKWGLRLSETSTLVAQSNVDGC